MIVFVYGTLKRGFRNHRVLNGATFLGEATTQPLYRIYDCPGFPCMVEDADGLAIKGELFEIDRAILRRLDMLEGYPGMYDRCPIELQQVDVAGNCRVDLKQTDEVLAYFWQGSTADMEDLGTEYTINHQDRKGN